jgi:hypothetical protein
VSGALCVYGSRVPVDVPLHTYAAGAEEAEIEASWPSVPPSVLRRLVGLSGLVLQDLMRSGGWPLEPPDRTP